MTRTGKHAILVSFCRRTFSLREPAVQGNMVKRVKKTLDSVFSLRMLVAEHKHPVMPTKNRLREFFVGDACALTCSGMVGKLE